MIYQTKLTAETVDVYGEENTSKHYCTNILVSEGRVLNEEDESRIDFHGRSLLFLDQPGHDLHHYCIIKELTNSLFSGLILEFHTANLIKETVPLFYQLKLPSNLIQVQCEEHWIVFLSIEPQVVYLTH